MGIAIDPTVNWPWHTDANDTAWPNHTAAYPYGVLLRPGITLVGGVEPGMVVTGKLLGSRDGAPPTRRTSIHQNLGARQDLVGGRVSLNRASDGFCAEHKAMDAGLSAARCACTYYVCSSRVTVKPSSSRHRALPSTLAPAAKTEPPAPSSFVTRPATHLRPVAPLPAYVGDRPGCTQRDWGCPAEPVAGSGSGRAFP
jgi:hypothetical protein